MSEVFQFAAGFYQLLKNLDFSSSSRDSKASSITAGVSKVFQLAAGFFKLLKSLDVSKFF